MVPSKNWGILNQFMAKLACWRLDYFAIRCLKDNLSFFRLQMMIPWRAVRNPRKNEFLYGIHHYFTQRIDFLNQFMAKLACWRLDYFARRYLKDNLSLFRLQMMIPWRAVRNPRQNLAPAYFIYVKNYSFPLFITYR